MATEKWVETRQATTCGNAAHILIPKRLKGETFRVELIDDEVDQ
jgi:putative transposon-encoded protein